MRNLNSFVFLRAARLANLKGSVGLLLAKASAMRVTISIDLYQSLVLFPEKSSQKNEGFNEEPILSLRQIYIKN